MKGRGGLLLLLVVGAIIAFFYFGGEAEGPSETPDVTAPDTNEAANRVTEFFNDVGDFVSTRSDTFWTVTAIFVLVGVGMFVAKKVPLIVWLILAVLGIVVAVAMR